jgi:hypothetical protein
VNRKYPRRPRRQSSQLGPLHNAATAARANPRPTPRESFETLEDRRLLSVSVDAQGWTNIAPSADTRTIYVSSSQGSDTNSGLSPDSPFKTIARGKTLLRSGSPDWLLLKRGDVFYERYGFLNVSGRSEQEPILISAYGAGDRPLLNTRSDNAITTNITPVNHVAIVGLHFNSNTNDPASPDFTNTSAGYAFYGVAPVNDLLIEDCYVEHYGTNLLFQDTQGPETNIKVRRNVIADSSGGRSQGMYVNGVDSILVEDNLFDHNGWSEGPSADPSSIYNHDVYMSAHNGGEIVVRGNIFANASSHGLQARSGGIIENNLFLKNPIGLMFGNGTSYLPGGVEGHVADNVFMDGRDIAGAPRGYGIEVGNTKPGGDSVMEGNIFAHDGQGVFPAIVLHVGQAPTNIPDAVGLNDFVVKDNIVYDWYQALSTDSAYVPGASGLNALNNLTVEGNDFQNVMSTSTRLVRHGNPMADGVEAWDDNHYWDDSPSSGWFSVGTATKSFDEWQASLEPNANRTERRYRDPDRTVGTYNRSLGGAATSDAFLAEARKQSRQNWRPAYTAGGVNDYVRDGFQVDAAVPTAGLESPDVNSLGGTSHAFIVHYADDQGIDPRTLDSLDVRVTGPNGYDRAATLVSVDRAGTTTRAAIYVISAPAGGWSEADAGLYSVSSQSNQVSDLKGNYLPPGVIGTFWVRSDTEAPTASATVASVTQAGAKTHTITVTYADNRAVEAASLGTGDIIVTGPNGFEQFATLDSVTPAGDGSPLVASYSFATPDGSWDSADNGAYTVTLRPDEVRDTSGNTNPGGVLAKFIVAIGGTPLLTTRVSAANVISGGGTAYRFTVAYDGDGTAADPLTTPAVQVTGPLGYSRLATVESIAATSGGHVKVVTYTTAAPDGVWDAGDNGKYAIRRLPDGLAAQSEPGVPLPLGRTLGFFNVNIARADYAPPSIVAAGFSAAFADRFVMGFSEEVSASLGTSDFQVQRVGAETLTTSRLRLSYDSRRNRATLSFAGSGGELTAGLYRLVLRSDGVTDGAGNRLDGDFDGAAGGDYVIFFRKA